MVSFTGSTAVGKQILAQAAPTVKRVALELGGKSAQIYLDDAIGRTPTGAMQVVALTAGQACVAATRMLVPNDRKAEVLDLVAGAYGQLKVGHPDDPSSMLGPLISAAQREPVRALRRPRRGARRQGRIRRPAAGPPREGLLLRADGARPARQCQPGGPGRDLRAVIGVIGYEDLDDAVRIANDTVYGLSGQVYGADAAAAAAWPAGCGRVQSTSTPPWSAPMRRAAGTSRAASDANAARTVSGRFRK